MCKSKQEERFPLLQKIYMLILNPIAPITEKLTEGMRSKCIALCMFAFGWINIIGISSAFFNVSISNTERAILNSALLLATIIVSIKHSLRAVKWNRMLLFVWCACAILVIISAFLHPIGDGMRASALVMLVGFPCLFFVWNNRDDWNRLFLTISKAFIAVQITYFIFCIFIHTTQEYGVRYAATMDNPNPLGFFALTGVITALYLILVEQRHVWVYMLSCGISISFTVLCMSRASLIAECLIVVMFLVCLIRNIIHTKKVKFWCIRLIAAVIIISAIVPVGMTLLTMKWEVQAQSNDNVQASTETNIQTADNQVLEQGLKNRIAAPKMDLNAYSSGRIQIWKAYMHQLNWMGNDIKKHFEIEAGVRNYGAHNTPLEIAYRSGIPAGLLFLLLEVIAGLYMLRYLFGRRRIADYQILYIFAVAGYCVVSMFESLIFPMSKGLTFLFFTVMMVPLAKTESNNKQSHRSV